MTTGWEVRTATRACAPAPCGSAQRHGEARRHFEFGESTDGVLGPKSSDSERGIGTLPVSEVTSADVIETLRPVWHVRPATARRVRDRISTVMEWAVAMDLRADNPCDLRVCLSSY